MEVAPFEAAEKAALADQRQHVRVPGPFDGARVGIIETPVRIYDLSEGGCFVTALYDARPGAVIELKIELPQEGCIRVAGEVLYNRHGFGFAVQFTEVAPHVRQVLAEAVRRRQKFVESLV